MAKSSVNDIEKIKALLAAKIKELYVTKGLILIGGFQSSSSTVDLLLFKEDEGTGEANQIELSIKNFSSSQWGVNDN